MAAKKTKMTVDRAVEIYIKIRDDIAAKKKQFKESIADLEDQMESVEGFIKDHLNSTKTDSIKTKFGTASKVTKSYVGVEDWDSLKEFIISENAWEFVKRDVVKTPVEEYLEENGALPPGVKYTTEVGVQIRKPR